MRKLLAVGAAIMLLVSPALADTTAFGDRSDTPGRFDFRKMAQGHSGDSVTHKLVTYEAWTKSDLRSGNNFINFFFDTDDGGGYERRLTINVNRSDRLKARMLDWETKDFIGTVPISRANHRSLEVTIPVELLGAGVTSYRWRSGSFFHTDDKGPCGIPSDVSITCTDRFPDRGLATHNL